MKFAAVRRFAFHAAAAVSLVLCLLMAALWARSLGHFEMVTWRYNRWRQVDEVQCYGGFFAWYSNTVRLEVSYCPVGPEFFASVRPESQQTYRKQRPPGAQWAFVGEDRTLEMNGYPEGFSARHYPCTTAGVGDRFVLGVRPWLPTLLAAILPAIWLIQYRRHHGLLWKFGLRELLLSVTTIAALLGAGLWLKR